jgi:hypothetical protein
MSVVTLSADVARVQWRKTIDLVFAHQKEIVVERYGEPIAAIMSYGNWLEMKRKLKEMELTIKVLERHREVKNDPSSFVSEQEYERILQAEGLNV